MASTVDEDADAVLSDVEGDDAVPIVLNDPSQEDISVERFREILSELERERKGREAAENAKSELQTSFNRLKVLAHEAIKKRDESGRQREEALREKEELLRSNERISGELAEALRLKDELLKQREDVARQLDEAVKARDLSRSEVEVAAHMLVTGMEKISGKVSNFKNFSGTGLPRSQKYTGLPAVAYGIIKRTNEIVEELLGHLDTATKARNDARERMEQRNYEIAIEVSQLEATINGLREEVVTKTSEIDNLEKAIAEKDENISEMDKEMTKKLNGLENEAAELREMVKDYDHKLSSLELKMDSQRSLLVDQLNYVSKIHDHICNVIKMVDPSKSDQSDLSESIFLPQEMDMNENLRASLAGMESIYELTKIAAEKIRNEMEERSREAKCLNETVDRLVKEKQHIGYLLRSVLSSRMTSDPSSEMNEVLQIAEKSLREAGMDLRFNNLLGNDENLGSHDKLSSLGVEEDEVYTLVGALEKIIKASQLEIIELRHSVDELRVKST
uniref:Uncharacterized protein n=1 Tax=Nelumbo nucifera TaxID=4432 RepID=A0A822YQL6_NELNU|nr:TPA_asm: hypothetical protein HUJ06_005053 [Nelumbo nucifera]